MNVRFLITRNSYVFGFLFFLGFSALGECPEEEQIENEFIVKLKMNGNKRLSTTLLSLKESVSGYGGHFEVIPLRRDVSASKKGVLPLRLRLSVRMTVPFRASEFITGG